MGMVIGAVLALHSPQVRYVAISSRIDACEAKGGHYSYFYFTDKYVEGCKVEATNVEKF